MTERTSRTARGHVTTGMFAVFGAAIITGATWVGGDRGLAIALAGFYLLSCGVSYLWSRGTGDVAAIMLVHQSHGINLPRSLHTVDRRTTAHVMPNRILVIDQASRLLNGPRRKSRPFLRPWPSPREDPLAVHPEGPIRIPDQEMKARLSRPVTYGATPVPRRLELHHHRGTR
jgi:hypothetical protein